MADKSSKGRVGNGSGSTRKVPAPALTVSAPPAAVTASSAPQTVQPASSPAHTPVPGTARAGAGLPYQLAAASDGMDSPVPSPSAGGGTVLSAPAGPGFTPEVTRGSLAATVTTAGVSSGHAIPVAVATAAASVGGGRGAPDAKDRVAVDAVFFARLRTLLRIMFPRLWCSTTGLVVAHSAFLVARTVLSIGIVNLDGAVVGALVDRKPRAFVWLLIKWLGVGFVCAVVNAAIRYLERRLALSCCSRLTTVALDRYMRNDTYYAVSNLDTRLANVDQCLTEDILHMTELVSHLYSHLSKPILDVILISHQLAAGARAKGTGLFWPTTFSIVAVALTSQILKFASPAFGKLVRDQAACKGHYRFVHSRLIAASEEIAFYRGDVVERNILWRAYEALVKQLKLLYSKRLGYGILEGFLLKYTWSACGFILVAFPVFFGKGAQTESASDRTQSLVTARGLLVNAADAIERVMSSYQEITELAGYTARVAGMFTVFDDVSAGKYVRAAVSDPEQANLMAMRGTVEVSKSGVLEFDHVSIVTPTGDMLVKDLTFKIHKGMHVLVTGPNGCGKSSLFRILGGLWPLHQGHLITPGREAMFYIPQKPYLCLGSLREQVLYPHTVEQATLAGVTDEQLRNVFATVKLDHIVEREGGWDVVKPWADVLSGGEKQRLGMARVLYHKPTYAILDECTSAVSLDAEGAMYSAAKSQGITLLTISHRPSLWQYHDWILRFDGHGSWEFAPLHPSATESAAATHP